VAYRGRRAPCRVEQAGPTSEPGQLAFDGVQLGDASVDVSSVLVDDLADVRAGVPRVAGCGAVSENVTPIMHGTMPAVASAMCAGRGRDGP